MLTAQIALPASRYPQPEARRAFWQRLAEKAQQIPGRHVVGLTSNVPFNGNVSSGSYSIVGYTPGPGEARPHARQEVVGADYFRAMQIPVVEGRVFNEGDTADSAQVAVVDRYLVDKYFKGRSAIGQEIQRGGATARIRIVGVVGIDQQHRSRAAGDEGADLSSAHAAAARRHGARRQGRRSSRRS